MIRSDFAFRVFLCVLCVFCGSTITAAGGLDSLDDDRLLSELASRGLTTLLEHAFETQQVPQEKREAIRALAALRELERPDAAMTPPQRREMIRHVAAGIERILPTMTDPRSLMQSAAVLTRHAIEPDVNTLEYWGENARLQQELRPVVEAVRTMLDRAAAASESAAERIADTLTGPNDPRIEQWIELDALATSAAYTRRMVDYALVLALPRTDPARQRIADEAIAYLRQFDNAESEVQPIVRMRIAKLKLAAGQPDAAGEMFESLAAAAGIAPPPDVAQQYEARYFVAVCDLEKGNLEAAESRLEELTRWHEANLPEDARAGARAAETMLLYRVHSARAEAARDARQRQQANDAAVAALIELLREQPAFRPVIMGQLIDRIPDEAPLDQLDLLLLQALVHRGDEERVRVAQLPPAVDALDRQAISRAIDAAREIIARASRPGITDSDLEYAAIRAPFFLVMLGEYADAADAFIDYIESNHTTPQHVSIAFEHALSIVGQLRRERPDDRAVLRLYDRFLAVAVNPPFSRSEFAFEYARRLQTTGRLEDAVEMYARVPEDDPRRLTARFFELTVLHQIYYARQTGDAQRDELRQQVQALADRIIADARVLLADAEGPRQARLREIAAKSAMLAADLVKETDPRRALALVSDVEEQSANLPQQQDLLGEALLVRVQAHMATGQTTDATQAMVRLIEARGGAEGANIIFHLLKRLDEDLDRARAADDLERMRELARSRAMLSGFLVDWAAAHPDPGIRRFTYRYRVFDAATKHLAAQLEPEPSARQALLSEALALYQSLRSPENVQLYLATLEDAAQAASAVDEDPAVTLGLALVHFDLGQYAEAQPLLGRLLAQRRLGAATIPVHEHGELRFVDNDQYWEAQYKLMRSNVELARGEDDPALKATRNHLAMLYVREGERVGGTRWREHFDRLRQELLPDLEIESATAEGLGT